MGVFLTYLLCVNIVGQHEKSSERRVANGVAGFMSILVFLFPALSGRMMSRYSSNIESKVNAS